MLTFIFTPLVNEAGILSALIRSDVVMLLEAPHVDRDLRCSFLQREALNLVSRARNATHANRDPLPETQIRGIFCLILNEGLLLLCLVVFRCSWIASYDCLYIFFAHELEVGILH